MTGGATRSFARPGESRPGLGLLRPARTRPAGYGRTSRNECDKQETRRYIENILWSRSGARPNDPANCDLRAKPCPI